MVGIPVVGAHEEASCSRSTRGDLVVAGFVSTRGGLVMAGFVSTRGRLVMAGLLRCGVCSNGGLCDGNL